MSICVICGLQFPLKRPSVCHPELVSGSSIRNYPNYILREKLLFLVDKTAELYIVYLRNNQPTLYHYDMRSPESGESRAPVFLFRGS